MPGSIRKNVKGYTLIELNMVIVIVAILFAIMIPTCLDKINEANKKTSVVEARTVLLALQCEASENYNNTEDGLVFSKGRLWLSRDVELTNDYRSLVDDEEIASGLREAEFDRSTVKHFIYKSTSRYMVKYENKSFTIIGRTTK